MMNLKYVFLALAFSASGCKSTDTSSSEKNIQAENLKSVEIKAMTRGYREEIKVNPKEVEYSSTSEQMSKEIIQDQWQKIVDEVNSLDLDNLKNLKAPTQNRFVDGDLATTVTINTKDSIYTSSAFDKKNPPAELKSLVDLVYALKK